MEAPQQPTEDNVTHPAKEFWSGRSDPFGRTSSNATMFRFLGQAGFDFTGKKVLEIGFGFGADLMEAERRGADIYGIDISVKAVDAIRERTGRNTFLLSDATQAPIPFPLTFDAIYSRDTVYYFSDAEIRAFGRHCTQALGPGGLLMLHFIQGNYRRQPAGNSSASPVPWSEWQVIDGVFHADNPIRILEPEALCAMIGEAGLILSGKKTVWETYGINEEFMQCNRYLLFRCNSIDPPTK